MHDLYFFNGQDISMNFCIQVHRVIKLIQKQEDIDFLEAANLFYTSETYKILENVENALWAESAEYILDRYNEEKNSK